MNSRGKAMSDKVRLAVIGCGGIANAHLRGYQALVEKGVDTFSIEATCDVRREAAQDYAERVAELQGIVPRVYDEVEEMLKAEDFETVRISVHHMPITTFPLSRVSNRALIL